MMLQITSVQFFEYLCIQVIELEWLVHVHWVRSKNGKNTRLTSERKPRLQFTEDSQLFTVDTLSNGKIELEVGNNEEWVQTALTYLNSASHLASYLNLPAHSPNQL